MDASGGAMSSNGARLAAGYHLAAVPNVKAAARKNIMGIKNTIRVVTRASDGTLRIRDYPSTEPLLEMHSQIGIDDCSTDLSLRGLPVFRGLVGPMPEGKNVVRYESPDVFETLTKEWSSAKNPRRRRRMQPPEGTIQTSPAPEAPAYS
jgi:hypothetical protein